MPMLIETLDQIARIKERDVLYIDFDYDVLCPKDNTDDDIFNRMSSYDYENCPVRQQLINWLEQNHIAYQPCLPFSTTCVLMGGYYGGLYIDIPYDESLPDYQKLSEHLETPEGEMKIKGIKFCYLPLEQAMKNKCRDEPDFWDKNF